MALIISIAKVAFLLQFALWVSGTQQERNSHVLSAMVDTLTSVLSHQTEVLAQQSEMLTKVLSQNKESTEDDGDLPPKQQLTCGGLSSFNISFPWVECPYPFKKVVGECFFFSKIKLNWSNARQHCTGMGGDLATPKHLYALRSFLMESSSNGEQIWIGLKRDEGTLEWLWNNEQEVITGDWAPGEPNTGSYFCGSLYCHLTSHPPIYDNNCATALRFACQYH